MKRAIALLLLLCGLASLSGCAPSPTAVTVGGRKVDASEYAFYLHYNCVTHGVQSTFSDEETAVAREAALAQITTGELVRLKCAALGLELSEQQRQALADEKAELIESLGGKAAYLAYLEESCLTDRAYDKFCESALYYELLYDAVARQTEYTDESLRQFFADSYLTLKYIRFPNTDDYGEPLSEQALATVRREAERVLERALEGEDFDLLVQAFGGVSDGSTGVIIGRLEAAGIDYLEAAFLLDPNTTDGVYEMSDGYYVLRRLPVDAGYYEANRDYILQSARDWAFSQALESWKGEAEVVVAPVVDKIDLNNVHTYVK